MSLPNEFLMRVNSDSKSLYYLRREDRSQYRLREAALTDKEAEERGEFPYWDAETVARYIKSGAWLIERDLDEPVSDVDVNLGEVL